MTNNNDEVRCGRCGGKLVSKSVIGTDQHNREMEVRMIDLLIEVLIRDTLRLGRNLPTKTQDCGNGGTTQRRERQNSDVIRLLKAERDSLRAENAGLREACTLAKEAMDLWTLTYAPEFSDEDAVKAAQTRIYEAGGTLAFIADLAVKLQAALAPAAQRALQGGGGVE